MIKNVIKGNGQLKWVWSIKVNIAKIGVDGRVQEKES